MPPKSKAQARLFRAVAGSKDSAGIVAGGSQKYVSGYPTKKLPERKKPAPMKGKFQVV